VIALDKTTIAALREHRFRQQAERTAAGLRWTGTGYVFTTKAGKPVGPDRVTRLFRRLVADAGLPPVTLHGLRHGAATLVLAAGTDLKVVPVMTDGAGWYRIVPHRTGTSERARIQHDRR
jgi:integrase